MEFKSTGNIGEMFAHVAVYLWKPLETKVNVTMQTKPATFTPCSDPLYDIVEGLSSCNKAVSKSGNGRWHW